MDQTTIKHEHLKILIEDIYDMDNILTEDMFLKLINELRFSNLLIPATKEDQSLNFIIYEIDNCIYTPLFTDLDEFHKFYTDGDFRVLDNSFELYRNIVETKDIDGFILNPASHNYILDKDLILSIDFFPKTYLEVNDGYSKEEYLDLYYNLDNSSLNNFLQKRENIGDFEGLFEEFSKSRLLTLMLSAKNLDSESAGGLIDMSQTGPLAFMHVDNVGGKYVTLFSAKNKIKSVNLDSRLYKYAQIVNLNTLVNYILMEDMDGIILNPNEENVLIPRPVLLKYSFGFEKYCNESKLCNAIFYMFDIEY